MSAAPRRAVSSGKLETRRTVTDRTAAEIAQSKILSSLACPLTRGPIDVLPREIAGAAVRNAVLWSRNLERPVGEIREFQLNLLNQEELSRRAPTVTAENTERPPIYTHTESAWETVHWDAADLAYEGPVAQRPSDALALLDGPSASVSFIASGEIEVLFLCHSWSGVVEVRHEDVSQTVDLYSLYAKLPRPLRLQLPASTRVEIRPTGEKNGQSMGLQCLFGGFRRRGDSQAPVRHHRPTAPETAGFTPAFYDLFNDLPESAIVLDLGGGRRQCNDARYVSLDRIAYAEPDVLGDMAALPFRNGSIDAIYSTDCFEHLVDPLQSGREVERVVKRGGKLVVDWAFLQPAHKAPEHYFNATPWGVERTFPHLKLKRRWFNVSFAQVLDSIVAEAGLRPKIGDADITAVRKTLEAWDAAIEADRLPGVAGSVWSEFEKL
jgi:SAM-dependent methyltransferase